MIDRMKTFGSPEPDAKSDKQHLEHFWAEIAPSEHLVQIYDEDSVFLECLEGFVAKGLEAGDAVIVIAKPDHQRGLENRLSARGISLEKLVASNQYLALDAQETLSKFMVDGPIPDDREAWPDEERFSSFVGDLMRRASSGPDGQARRVRAFGEMVALLWEQGKVGATVRLEYIWQEFCHTSGLSLLCAYPRAYFTQDAGTSIKQICDAHSRVLSV